MFLKLNFRLLNRNCCGLRELSNDFGGSL